MGALYKRRSRGPSAKRVLEGQERPCQTGLRSTRHRKIRNIRRGRATAAFEPGIEGQILSVSAIAKASHSRWTGGKAGGGRGERTRALGAEAGHVAAAQLLARVPLAALGAVLAEAPRVPRAVCGAVLGADVQELAVVLGAVPLHEEVTQGHPRHVVLVQILTTVQRNVSYQIDSDVSSTYIPIAFLALTSQPMFTYISSLCSLMTHRTLVSHLTMSSGDPASINSETMRK